MKRFENSDFGKNGNPGSGNGQNLEESFDLFLRISDSETCETLRSFDNEEERDQFALNALKFGCKMFREASGTIDRNALRKEGTGIIERMERALEDGSRESLQALTEEFRRFFDPESGIFQQRLERLISGDGSELNQALKQHLDRETENIGQILEKHVGENSELLKILSPDQKDGLIHQLQVQFQQTLGDQSQHILNQFSLDQEDSALNRLIKSISDSNGELKEELAGDVHNLQSEFSLDNENSALNRIMNQLLKSEGSIEKNLTLDHAGSPMARMRREIMDLLEKETEKASEFRGEVMALLEAQKARREEAARSTHQGRTFEDQLNEFIERESQNKNDFFEATGSKAGKLGRDKVGDGLITLGPDSRAPGANIVIEAKKAKNYSLKKALEEIERAKENRDAQCGVFVFAMDSAPKNIKPVDRYGMDVVVLWDPENESSDAYLIAGLSIARNIVIAEVNRDESEIDLGGFEEIVRDIETQAVEVERILKKARTVENSGKDIAKLADSVRARILNQAQDLDDLIDPLRKSGEK